LLLNKSSFNPFINIIPPEMSSKTHINLSCYVALGDSLTAGYADGALHYEGQQNSYVDIIARQFKTIGGGDFRQPLLNPGSVGINLTNTSRLVLKKTNNPQTNDFSLTWLAEPGDSEALLQNIFGSHGPFNNTGVPGAKIISSLKPGYGNPAGGPGNYNPFFARMASHPPSSSILSDVLTLNPSFFSLFIGNNDALAYALTGGVEDAITPLAGPPGVGFAESLETLLQALTANGAKGVIANIPDLISVPFFTCIPYNGLLLSPEKAALLTSKYDFPGIHFQEGENLFLVSDTAGVRHMKKGELILLDVLLDRNKSLYLTGEAPIPKKYFLAAAEITSIQDAITEYNLLIESVARSKKLAFVDVNALLKKVRKDRSYNSLSCNLDYTKGVFSLDGLHPNPLGHALLANEFIKAINTTYRSAIPLVKITPYKRISVSNKTTY